MSDRFQKDHGVDSKEFIGALKEIMPVVRQPHASDSYSLWKPYLDTWNVSLNEGEFFDYWFSGEKLVLELLDYVEGLREEGLKVFILSNNFRERTEYYREHFPELFKELDKAYFSWETGFIKPDEKAYGNVLEENGLKGEECAYFDDSSKNVKVAKNLGIHAYGYEGFKATKETIERLLK